MNEQSELEFVRAAKRGDSGAVAELYRRYWKAARAVAYGVNDRFVAMRAEEFLEQQIRENNKSSNKQ